MTKQIIALIVAIGVLTATVGCTSVKKVSVEDLSREHEQIVTKIEAAFLSTGDVVRFSKPGGVFYRDRGVIVGTKESGAHVEVSIDEISYVRVRRKSRVRTALATAAGIILVAVLVADLEEEDENEGESCPFVYSYDGEKYVFDAEPLGGAITEGLEKTDYSRLDHLESVEGKYYLLLRNELEETQFTDEIALLVVDHSMSSEVIPDLMGNLYAVEDVVAPSSARDESRRDLMKFVEQRDDVFWQTDLRIDSLLRGQKLRNQLTFEFPKPPDAKTAKLVVNAGTALWGSNMVRRMLEDRGDRVDAWYEAINRAGPELMRLALFVEREELFVLKVYVKEDQGWIHRGFIPGGGPLITEDRVIPIDLSDISGDTLTIRLHPPLGFWAINYIGIDYGNHPTPEAKKVPLASAEDRYGEDVSEQLRAADKTYQVLSEVGDWTDVSFDAPPQPEGTRRSVFLKTSGYYQLHLSKDQPEQTEVIHTMLTTPGMIVEYAMSEYLKRRGSEDLR